MKFSIVLLSVKKKYRQIKKTVKFAIKQIFMKSILIITITKYKTIKTKYLDEKKYLMYENFFDLLFFLPTFFQFIVNSVI